MCGAWNSPSPYDRHKRPPARPQKTLPLLLLLLLLLLLALSPPPLLQGWGQLFQLGSKRAPTYVGIKKLYMRALSTFKGQLTKTRAGLNGRAQLTKTQETRHRIAMECSGMPLMTAVEAMQVV